MTPLEVVATEEGTEGDLVTSVDGVDEARMRGTVVKATGAVRRERVLVTAQYCPRSHLEGLDMESDGESEETGEDGGVHNTEESGTSAIISLIAALAVCGLSVSPDRTPTKSSIQDISSKQMKKIRLTNDDHVNVARIDLVALGFFV